MSPDSHKPSTDPTVKAAWISFLGAILAAIIAGLFSLVVAGRKANEASDKPTSFVANLQAGLTLVNPSRPASESFNPATRTASTPAAVTSVQPIAPMESPTAKIHAGTCSGLDKKVWSVEIAPVTLLRGTGHSAPESGYNVNLRLSNVSDRVLDVNYNQAEATDDQGNQLSVKSASVPPNNPNFAPNEVAAGADLAANFKFFVDGTLGKTMSLTINLHTFTKNQDVPRIDKVETLACTNVPVE